MTTMHPRGWSGAVVWSCRRAMHELGLLIVASHFLVCFCCVSLLEAAVSLTCGPWSYRETMQTPIKICRNFSCSPCDERARARHQFTTYVAVRTVHEQINVVVCLPVFVTLEWQSRLSSSRPEHQNQPTTCYLYRISRVVPLAKVIAPNTVVVQRKRHIYSHSSSWNESDIVPRGATCGRPAEIDDNRIKS